MTPTKLRPYQEPVFRRVLHSVGHSHGDIISVLMARQSGKNETSAVIEAALLAANMADGGTGIKAAPTLTPQAAISRRRLEARLRSLGLRQPDYQREGNDIILGAARWTFSSASPDASVVGQTASILLEGDEAQDIDPETWDKSFRPMAASTNSTAVFYGTPWTDDTLLAQAIADGHAAEDRDGRRRVFEVPWDVVAEHVPDYGLFVESERARLGANHPIFLTQYELQTLAGAGRLLSASQLAAIRGEYARQVSAQRNAVYVAGIDVAGEDTAQHVLRGRDSTVCAIARVTHRPAPQEPLCELVQAYEWAGTPHKTMYSEIAALLAGWHIAHVTVDSTAIGEALAHVLTDALGERRVTGLRFTERSKSDLGYGLQSAAMTGALKLWANDQSAEYEAIDYQLRQLRAEYQPNQNVRWFVPEKDGHDDHAIAVALALHSARTMPPPRRARSRPGRNK